MAEGKWCASCMCAPPFYSREEAAKCNEASNALVILSSSCREQKIGFFDENYALGVATAVCFDVISIVQIGDGGAA